jgi:hypothetical protein
VGRFLSSKNWGSTSATPLYSSDIQAQPERLCSPVSINLLSRKVRGLVLPFLGGGSLPIFTPGIQWCGSQDLNVRNGQDRILGLLNFLYFQANTGAVAEVKLFDKKQPAPNRILSRYGCNSTRIFRMSIQTLTFANTEVMIGVLHCILFSRK